MCPYSKVPLSAATRPPTTPMVLQCQVMMPLCQVMVPQSLGTVPLAQDTEHPVPAMVCPAQCVLVTEHLATTEATRTRIR